ncbi:MAG: hypothetical protein JNK19_15600 [Tabrizicola sp.]|nr:hypothetical protein [Tabrizicola sp.]
MFVGVLLIAMMTGAAATATLVVLKYPFWIALLAYPVVGSTVLLLGLVLVGLIRWFTSDPTATGSHFPVARSTTPTVANNILKSVTNDKLRS